MKNLSSSKDAITKIEEQLIQLVLKRHKLVQELQTNDGISSESLFTRMVHLAKKKKDEQMIEAIEDLFKGLSDKKKEKTFLYSREHQKEDTIVMVNGERIGNGDPHLIMGPCAVESDQQVREVAAVLKQKGVKLLRGGAFKPRTSPYDFQGLGVEGLEILSRVAREHNMAVVTEIMSADQIEEAIPFVDVIQVGSRNMQNFSLLNELGRIDKPILLKRGLSATIEEFKLAAEYILSHGNKKVILCERGIRTYETATRNTLDISAVPILKQETHLPVIVDVTHSTGRKDLLAPAAKAALAIGADGIMAEVHPDPANALSDSKQQMNLNEFEEFYSEIQHFLKRNQYELTYA
ncbi:bifunctional 3-deoxy-7-phosphoheptulonate synthase/chorismate mutase [Neobacillus sedimentimangrovi]|uniref:Bifunctional 3-deoxy-7-phosphoheptulonate synthase/chorismate mutase n=2 Tax=Neobacillus sedimentimangrovi TaxID=2699460 RepID=A0ABS8QKT1_9BACI|nr:bifunctional 3-deoxy-7-phosphoheptulonate synthase/chorismate mutase [Neobacillus sedimentimangrovi]MCD4839431.1 bifunctional 3-deoxy-7-phosphoheptulonate synthase/chorismate mutase [Neobacillus sedimentimangrovi]